LLLKSAATQQRITGGGIGNGDERRRRHGRGPGHRHRKSLTAAGAASNMAAHKRLLAVARLRLSNDISAANSALRLCASRRHGAKRHAGAGATCAGRSISAATTGKRQQSQKRIEGDADKQRAAAGNGENRKRNRHMKATGNGVD
jgi:hypothetical protein